MKTYLFAALLGCCVVSSLAQFESFQFTDSQGRCWLCAPGAPCTPCNNRVSQPRGPFDFDGYYDPDHPRSCPAPDCANDPATRGVLYPRSDDPRMFYQCSNQNGAGWVAAPMPCQCGTFFDYQNQRCEFPWDWTPWCLPLPNPIPDPHPCDDIPTIPTVPPTPPNGQPTLPPNGQPTLPPNGQPTQPPNGPPGGPDQPCKPCPCMPCFIWWMCNPCSCNNGCSSSMG